MAKKIVVLVQLPIPPLGLEPVRGNVPLAGAYLKLWARNQGLDANYDIQIFPGADASTLSDRRLIAELAGRKPWLVGFTCYMWNIERTLWIAGELKRLCPNVRIVLGGPEITADNAWVLANPHIDYAAIGEGEQTFAQLLLGLAGHGDRFDTPIEGLHCAKYPTVMPAPRRPMPDLNVLGSPYQAGILDVADEQMLLLETTRGCRFKCKFCYYPKAYDKQYYLTAEAVLAELRHAGERGAHEVMLLDPTLNQRKDFADFLRLLVAGNPGQRFRYFGELRGEGIDDETARLLREANFTEVEVGLQSIEPGAMAMMDRKNNLRAFERGVRAMLREGIKVRVDLILGLPGDTVETIRRGMRYLYDGGLYSDVQVFHLAVLPGTSFRQEAGQLGLTFQPRPPYYVLRTPTMDTGDIFGLLQEAQTLFDVEFDALPPPTLTFEACPAAVWHVDLDAAMAELPPSQPTQAFTLWLRSRRLGQHRDRATSLVRRLLRENPFTTLQVVLEPMDADAAALTDLPGLAEALLRTCMEQPTYLDKFYAMHPVRNAAAKRLVVLLPACELPGDVIDALEEIATVVTMDAGVAAGVR